MNIKTLYYKYKDIIPYLFFGVCTTLVNVISYWFMSHVITVSVMISTIVAWILAVLFAYITNRKWVFNSNATTIKEIGVEISTFFGCRIATGVVDWGCMFLLVNILGMDDVIIKLLANIIVIILNYIASKMIIFKKKNEIQ